MFTVITLMPYAFVLGLLRISTLDLYMYYYIRNNQKKQFLLSSSFVVCDLGTFLVGVHLICVNLIYRIQPKGGEGLMNRFQGKSADQYTT